MQAHVQIHKLIILELQRLSQIRRGICRLTIKTRTSHKHGGVLSWMLPTTQFRFHSVPVSIHEMSWLPLSAWLWTGSNLCEICASCMTQQISWVQASSGTSNLPTWPPQCCVPTSAEIVVDNNPKSQWSMLVIPEYQNKCFQLGSHKDSKWMAPISILFLYRKSNTKSLAKTTIPFLKHWHLAIKNCGDEERLFHLLLGLGTSSPNQWVPSIDQWCQRSNFGGLKPWKELIFPAHQRP